MKILIIRLSSLGDVILTESTTAALRVIYPLAEINFLTYPAYAGIVTLFPAVNRVIPWQKRWMELGRLRQEKYDLIVDLQGKLSTFLLRIMLSASKRVCYEKKHFLRRKIVRKKTHLSIAGTIQLYASIFRKLGVSVAIKPPKLGIPKELLGPYDKSLAELRKNHHLLIGVFPGANHYTKIYPFDQLMQALAKLPLEWKAGFVLLGSSDEQDTCNIIANYFTLDSLNLCGQPTLQELVAIVGQLDMVFSNDSGPMHLAAALGKPQLAIFGATHTRLGFAPNNEKAIVLQADLPCQPCSLHGSEHCPEGNFLCMRSINPDHVVAAFKELKRNYYPELIDSEIQ